MGSVVPGPHGSMQKNTAPAPQETVACRLAEAQESPHQQQSVGDLGPLPKDDPNVVIKKKRPSSTWPLKKVTIIIGPIFVVIWYG